MSLVTFLLAAMVAWRAPTLPERPYFEEVAHDFAAVALDEEEAPVFDGEHAREKTALLLLSIASYESGGFARDVDLDVRKGDSGRSHCLLQVQLRPGDKLTDRQSCIRLGLARVRESLALCRGVTLQDRLGGYVRGRCIDADPEARLRWNRAHAWWAGHQGSLQP